jgi:hypothetical protein
VAGVRFHVELTALHWAYMPKLDVISILRTQLHEAKATVERLHHAVQALERLGRRERSRASNISAAGRRRIAEAQKARWKKLKLVKK